MIHKTVYSIFMISAVTFFSASLLAVEVHVTPNGDDHNAGTLDKPLRTFSGAQDRVRKIKSQEESIIVYLHGGTYYLSNPVTFTVEDSGSGKYPVIYTSSPGEKVIISGGIPLNLDWKPYKNGIYQADVPPMKSNGFDFDQLFVDGKRQNMARYPNYDKNARNYNGSAADAISPKRVKQWKNPMGGYVHALHKSEWGDYHYRITGVGEQGKLALEGGWQNNRRMGMHDTIRMVENIFEELDAPGEWFFDRSQQKLFYKPVEGSDINKTEFVAAGIRNIIHFNGTADKPVAHISIKGMTFTHTARTFMDNREPLLRSDWTIYRGGAVLLEGSEDCHIENCDFDQPGGNAIFFSNYNRCSSIKGCFISEAGANGICFVGDPQAVRSPSFEYNESVPLGQIDKTPGPKSNNYPAQCLAEDNLITRIGRIEKQSAGVEIAMASDITIRHSSIYDVPRAGINIGDGCWGGHIIEFNDVFDTVKETGDHGSFNSWGRDRYWHPNRERMNTIATEHPEMILLDTVQPIIIRNNRWRCDHGWDIDLDDGSSNYHIYNNLCLNGGLKLREGFFRTVENNIMINNSFHPHVWFQQSGDAFIHNIIMKEYQPIGMPTVWGKQIDFNLFQNTEALQKARKSGQDKNSIAEEPLFVDPDKGDYSVKPESQAFKIGFKNFPMDQFGVMNPRLRAFAKSPIQKQISAEQNKASSGKDQTIHNWLGAKVKNLTALGEISATGMPGATGIIVIEVPDNSIANSIGFHPLDVIIAIDGQKIYEWSDFLSIFDKAPKGKKLEFKIFRHQKEDILSYLK